MPLITFSNKSKRYYDCSISIMDIALSINKKLAQSCIAGRVNSELVDYNHIISRDALVDIITIEDDISLEIIRRSCMQLLGYAIKQLWPTSKMATSQIVGNNFYYDFDLDYRINSEDINKLEKYMHQLVNSRYNITNKKIIYQDARNLFLQKNEIYKIMILDERIDKEQFVSIYIHENFIDICKGPQVPNVIFCKNFKLQKVSGAYWNGNKNNKMLQRIYGTAWTNKKQLSCYIKQLEETTKRDHRKIGKQLDLYHFQKEAPGMVFWHHNGWIVLNELKIFISNKFREYEYQEVNSPSLMERKIWEKTGHWENYKQLMFTIISENTEYCVKPMNCPGHLQIFKQGIKSYRDLPVRMAEFGSCYRNEPSGSLHGLMRVRSFTQDDAHIFCTEDQLKEEVHKCINMIYDIYHTFGFNNISVNLATRPTQRIGTDKMWDYAEKSLESVLNEKNIEFKFQLGEGAFYGPKIEFTLLDCLDRSWQCGTIQLDFALAKRLDAVYIDKNNDRLFPVIVHRAVLGSLERFIGILIEEYTGFLPCWLSPVQVVVTSITDKHLEYVKKLTLKLHNKGFRVKSDLRNKKLGFKIREHTLHRVPYILIYGDEEVENNKISVRTRCGKNLGLMDINDFIQKLNQKICIKSIK
ncbi:threonine--tRNA ligase [Candidatus Pantoea edessiphila]|uniref:Threonine--tRNA ligase n=1 Tax=Candidatus Pantoea edessiphila TaxID=2044610 RepID=A0A2P5SWW1_9GAMM|nr:threonine--tRNA ligase [Candidatus Pantoea edessiphila]PPI86814.1 threonine--tRNA ligase [Candidatus Pantoea edessiphila]